MIMISMGSCMFTIVSNLIGTNNPDRIASNIVTGIGFLGEDVIFRGDNIVDGITTTATIWAVAAVGIGFGSGYNAAVAYASVLIIIVLAVLPNFEHLIDRINQSKTYIINAVYQENEIQELRQLFKQNKLRYSLKKQVKEGNSITTTWHAQVKPSNHEAYLKDLNQFEHILRSEY